MNLKENQKLRVLYNNVIGKETIFHQDINIDIRLKK